MVLSTAHWNLKAHAPDHCGFCVPVCPAAPPAGFAAPGLASAGLAPLSPGAIAYRTISTCVYDAMQSA